MTVRNLVRVSGTSIAITLASAAAQQDTRTTQTDPIRDSAIGTVNSGQVEDLLQKRQGVWQVEVMLNSAFWSKHHGAGAGTGVDSRYITRPDNPNSTPDLGDKPTDPATTDRQDKGLDDPANPWFNDPTKKNEDPQTTRPSHTHPTSPSTATQPADVAGQPGMMRLNGYAESSLVLGGPILQERIVVPTSGGAQFDADTDDNRDAALPNDFPDKPDAQQPDAIGAGLDDGSFRGISFLEFNESDKTYDIVFLTNKSEGIKYDSGHFDAQRNRIVFRGRGGDMRHDTTEWSPTKDRQWQNDWDSRETGDPSHDNLGDPSHDNLGDPDGDRRDDATRDDHRDPARDTLNDPTRDNLHAPSRDGTATRGQAGAPDTMDSVVVVLEFIDDDTHRVTMYDTGSTTWPMSDRPSDLRDDLDHDLNNDINELDDDAGGIDDDANTLEDDVEDFNDQSGQREADDDIDDLDNRSDDALDTARPDATRTQPGVDSPIRTSSEFGRVIYQATYTRAPGSMEASIRSMIDREITVASR